MYLATSPSSVPSAGTPSRDSSAGSGAGRERGVHAQASGEAVLNLPIPNDPSLVGGRIPGQGFAFNPFNSAILGSNTFSYVIE
jgi:hypothetical protein